ncbi:TIGR01777 family oxidoreductase [Aeromonas enteropelogenes]|uniref:TIGR01777 family oxidoreductase n=1 Tax=Aeromonas enteropelogenes TaxID=29489 RepID=UPI00191CF3D7|nr:TIGR01777 family oxidoreductase [Aeromonas enteropelogenes]MBL0520490.1 TIGR01777 family oxidoreductase [Aeromonas enteropelogenes]
MKILITGGTGFIGRRLVAHLKVNHEVVVLSRQGSRAYTLLGHDIKVLDSLDRLDDLNDVDAVINLAGEPIAAGRWSEQRKQLLCDSRWLLTEQLVDLIKLSTTPPKVLINASAIGWYGRQDDAPLDEQCQTPHDEFTHQLCQQWETLAQEARSRLTRVCIVRIGLVLGTDGGALPKMLPPYRFGLGGPMGAGNQVMSWIHVQDLVRAILFLLEHGECDGIFNCTAPHPVSNREFSQALAHTLHRPHLFFVPAALLRLMMGEASDLLLTGQHVLPARLQQAGFHFTYPELPQALTNLLRSPR